MQLPEYAPEACEIASGASDLESIKIALDSHVQLGDIPVVLEQSSRHQRLVGKDCFGNLLAGAAVTWQKSEGGQTWIFELRDKLQDQEGNYLDADALVSYWKENGPAPKFVEAEAIGPLKIAVRFAEVHDSLPEILFSNQFVIPIVSQEDGVSFSWTKNEDGRDFLADQLHGIVTLDADVIDYASRQEDWLIYPMQWDRSYVLVLPEMAGESDPPAFPVQLTERLIDEVVFNDARAFEGRTWWEEVGDCDIEFQMSSKQHESVPSGTHHILYLSDEPAIKSIAERLAALNSGGFASDITAALSTLFPRGNDWLAKLSVTRTGSPSEKAAAYLLAFPKKVDNACKVLQEFSTTNPALFDQTTRQLYPTVAVMDVRPTLIIKKETARIELDGDGMVIISNPHFHP